MRIDNSFLSLFENKLEENDNDDSVCFFKRNNSDRDYFYMFNPNYYEKSNTNIDEEQIECDKQEENNMLNEASITIQHNTIENSPKADATLEVIQLEENKDKNIAVEIDIIEYPNVFDVDMTENINNEKTNLNEDETLQSKQTNKKYVRKSKTTEFAYLLERKAFRMMRRYYKEKFEFEFGSAEYKKNLPTMSASELNSIICQFMEQEFMMLSKILSQNDYERTRDALKTIILCDRYKKKEKISEGLNFTPFRNVIHKYNTRNLIDYLSDASNAYLYTHFFLINGYQSCEEQEDVQKDKLIQRMRHLMLEAANYLPKQINTLFEEIYNSNNFSCSYLDKNPNN